MFCGDSSLTELKVNNLNTSSVTDMYAVFSGCNNLTELDLSKGYYYGRNVYKLQEFNEFGFK